MFQRIASQSPISVEYKGRQVRAEVKNEEHDSYQSKEKPVEIIVVIAKAQEAAANNIGAAKDTETAGKKWGRRESGSGL